MTGHEELIRIFFARGLRVTEEGKVVGLRGRERRPQILNQNGYKTYRVNLSVDGKNKHVAVHKLAAFQWFGEQAFAPGVQVRHLDGNSLNNRRENIALGSQSDNMMDRPVDERKRIAKYAASFNKRLTAEQLALFRLDREAGFSLNKLAAKYGLAKSTCSYIVNNKTYQ